jgi:hypothetical protein
MQFFFLFHNSFFATRQRQKVTWKHPRSGHWHQLDFIFTGRQHLNYTQLTRSYQNAECDTDHTLVAAQVKLRLKKIYTAKHKVPPRIKIKNIKDPDKCFEFQQQFEEAFIDTSVNCTAGEKWDTMKDAIHQTAVKVYGNKEHNSHDWFEANTMILQPLFEKKKTALLRNREIITRNTLSELDQASNEVQKAARHQLTTLCWRERQVYKALRIHISYSLYKNFGDRSSCDNYR